MLEGSRKEDPRAVQERNENERHNETLQTKCLQPTIVSLQEQASLFLKTLPTQESVYRSPGDRTWKLFKKGTQRGGQGRCSRESPRDPTALCTI